MMSRVTLNTVHIIPPLCEVHIMKIRVSNQMGYSVWVVSVLVPLVGWVLFDLGVGVVNP
jgi:hypothetical protein